MIELRDVSLSYEQDAVLKQFNMRINKGEFVTIIGSSGCGKTTVLKLINGLLTPQTGKVVVDGQDLKEADLIALRRKIGYVIQEVGLFPHMNVERNIAYVPSLEKRSQEKEMTEQVLAMMDIVGLERSYAGRYPEELSGGQRQRVGIARALMNQPHILLMDEPFGAVDGITRKKLQSEILEIYYKMKCTIVFVTHDIEEALKLGSRVIVMDGGQIVQDGSPEEIRKHPATAFVEELTGQ